MNLKLLFTQGGRGSGNFGHRGRPGQVGGSASSYIEKIEKRRDTMINPFDTRVTSFLNEIGDDVKAHVELDDYTKWFGTGEPTVHFNISVPQSSRGKGFGTEVMRELMKEADESGIQLIGAPSAFGPGKKMSTKQLWKWYLGLGFEKFGNDYVLYKPHRTLKIKVGKFHE